MATGLFEAHKQTADSESGEVARECQLNSCLMLFHTKTAGGRPLLAFLGRVSWYSARLIICGWKKWCGGGRVRERCASRSGIRTRQPREWWGGRLGTSRSFGTVSGLPPCWLSSLARCFKATSARSFRVRGMKIWASYSESSS